MYLQNTNYSLNDSNQVIIRKLLRTFSAQCCIDKLCRSPTQYKLEDIAKCQYYAITKEALTNHQTDFWIKVVTQINC